MLTKAERIRDYRRTGWQDCDNAFDGDDVPSANDLRESFDAYHEWDEFDLPEWRADLRDAWVNGWLNAAAVHVEHYQRKEAARLAKEENEHERP